MPQQRMRTIP